jgi:micrococcal nuclease
MSLVAKTLAASVLVGLLDGCASAHAAPSPKPVWPATVTYVVDGDTVRVRPAGGGKPVSIRLQGIDAPEICQAGGVTSRDMLTQRLLGKRVTVHGRHHDDYGRVLARIELDGEDAGKWMVARGMAWSYHSRGGAGPYAPEQRRAQAAKVGIFSGAHGAAPVYPAQFRKQRGKCR